MAVAILRIADVSVDFSGFRALNKVNFSMETGELRFLIGPNGAGKTTLLDVICGKVRPTKGRVLFGDAGLEIDKMADYRIARCGVSRKFQTPSVFENLTVFENMELSLMAGRGLLSSCFCKGDSGDLDRVHAVLRTVNLEEKTDWKAGYLSHGEKQCARDRHDDHAGAEASPRG